MLAPFTQLFNNENALWNKISALFIRTPSSINAIHASLSASTPNFFAQIINSGNNKQIYFEKFDK